MTLSSVDPVNTSGINVFQYQVKRMKQCLISNIPYLKTDVLLYSMILYSMISNLPDPLYTSGTAVNDDRKMA